jgi:hypothetical protein
MEPTSHVTTRRLPRRLSSIAVLAAAVGILGTGPAAAVGPFGPAEPLLGAGVTPSCQPQADAAIAADGTARGFGQCTGFAPGRIWFFHDSPGSPPTRETTPYVGRVLSVAWDGVDTTYVLFLRYDDDRPGDHPLMIGKRVDSVGKYAPTTTVSTTARAASADLVASAGRWWAVWSELRRDSGEGSAGTQLFQRHTLLDTQSRTRITSTASNVYNLTPTLAYASGRVTMVWTRSTVLPGSGAPTSDDLRIATSTGGPWSSRPLATLGDQNYNPDLAVYAGVTWVTWARDGRVVVANNTGGTFHSRTFATAGEHPTIAVSGTRAFVAWTTDRAYLAELSGGAWTSSQAAGTPSESLRVLAQGGKARVLYLTAPQRYETPDALYLRTQL